MKIRIGWPNIGTFGVGIHTSFLTGAGLFFFGYRFVTDREEVFLLCSRTLAALCGIWELHFVLFFAVAVTQREDIAWVLWMF